jgi:hypothetical protein
MAAAKAATRENERVFMETSTALEGIKTLSTTWRLDLDNSEQRAQPRQVRVTSRRRELRRRLRP